MSAIIEPDPSSCETVRSQNWILNTFALVLSVVTSAWLIGVLWAAYHLIKALQ